MRHILDRVKYFAATLLFLATTSVISMPTAFAATTTHGPNDGPNAPGNNGTVKIDDLDASDENSSNANDPHVACTFAVNFFNYDAATIDATVSFALQAPTDTGRTLTVVSGNLSPTFQGTGQAELDHSEQYTLAFTGAPQAQQGYHVKMTVHAPFSKGNDTKYKTFWVGPCITEPTVTEVAPTPPVATEPTCQNPDIVVTPPVIAGIIWNHTATTLKVGESVTFTATADTANNYVLKAGAQTEWHFTNDFNGSECPSKTVTPGTPTATEPTCAAPTMTISLPELQDGVAWTPAGATTLTPGQTVTYVATPVNGYTFTNEAKTTWEFKNTLNLKHCENLVKAGHVKFHEACGLVRDYYIIPDTDHVNYYVNGNVIPATPGKHHVQSAGTVTVTAEAAEGYTLVGEHVWSYTFTSEDCPQKVTPPRVIFEDFCGTEDDLFTIPSRLGVEYRMDGQVVEPGTYPASGTVTVTAYAQEGYTLKGQKTSWTHTFKNQECGGGNGGETTPLTPGTVSFTDLTCKAAGLYTIPATEGVVYKDASGKSLITGTYPVLTAANVSVTAYPLDETVSLTGTTQWQHSFTVPKTCGHVLGGSTATPSSPSSPTKPSSFSFVPSGKGAAAPELANTGAGTLIATIVASLMTLTAAAVYASRPRKALKQ